jgi:hypothetical protein
LNRVPDILPRFSHLSPSPLHSLQPSHNFTSVQGTPLRIPLPGCSPWLMVGHGAAPSHRSPKHPEAEGVHACDKVRLPCSPPTSAPKFGTPRAQHQASCLSPAWRYSSIRNIMVLRFFLGRGVWDVCVCVCVAESWKTKLVSRAPPPFFSSHPEINTAVKSNRGS